VIQLARELADDNNDTRGTLESGRVRPPGEGPAIDLEAVKSLALERLTSTLRELDPQTALKIRTLMLAGRDGQNIGKVDTHVSLDAGAAFAIMAADSSENGPLLIEYLRRGHALACAAGIDLEQPLADWQGRSADDIDERAWLSFGRQLAASTTRDWQCVGIIDSGTQSLSKLYLKFGDRAWWSFHALIDRPTPAGLARERKAHARGRSRSIVTTSLDAIAGKLDSLRGRALQRAARAIRARIGYSAAAAEV
jgi:hypothetical protein